MKANKYLFLFFSLLVLLIATSCASTPVTTEAPTARPATSTSAPTETSLPQVSEEPAQVAAEEPTIEPGEAPEVSPEAAAPADELDYCLECHSDQQMLIDTAKPQEEVVSENEGEG